MCSEGATAEGLPGVWQQLHFFGLERTQYHKRRTWRADVLDHGQSLVCLACTAPCKISGPSHERYRSDVCLNALTIGRELSKTRYVSSTPATAHDTQEDDLRRYTLMPRGDFVTRNSFYEALCAGSIPVVMDEDYFMHCAFSNVVDYSKFVRTIPEADFMGNETKNVLELLSGLHDQATAVKSLNSLWEVRIELSPLLQHVEPVRDVQSLASAFTSIESHCPGPLLA